MLSVIVRLSEQANLQRLNLPAQPNRAVRLKNLVETLQGVAKRSQQALKALLAIRRAEGRVSEVTYFWIFNGLALTATPAVIQELAARPEVLHITPNLTVQAPPLPPTEQGDVSSLAIQANLDLINVPTLWALGYRGQGIVVAHMDTGVDINHPDLGPKWRGGTNSWFDPYGEHPSIPVDIAGSRTGHGTQTMGIMVGGEHNGVAFGLAPEAQWIAVKVFKDDGSGTTAGFHAGFQWLLDPDGSPATPDAPNVVNNSWTYLSPNGCYVEFQPDLQALRAAGILPIFAAGNSGPSSSTSNNPANLPEALAVGYINNSNIIQFDSSRGPAPSASPCSGTIFPELVAPGKSIHTTDLSGQYINVSGTSMAAPHVTGGLALLLDALPNLTTAEQEAALLNSAVDLGAVGDDNNYGQGRIDLAAALFPFSADLAVVQTASSNKMTTNNMLTYTMAITNYGPATAVAATLSDTLPAEVIFSSVTPSQGSCNPPSAGMIVCALGDLPNSAAAIVTLTVTPSSGGTIANTVSISSTKPDLVVENNTVTANATVLEQLFVPLIIKD
jgi:uncharacterized repeat protein (TIGR01451 family)